MINAKMFIVPNWAITLKSQIEWEKPIYGGETSIEKKLENVFGEKFSEDELLIEIWVFEDENSEDPNKSGNWSCHGRKIPDWDDQFEKKWDELRKRPNTEKEREILDREWDFNEWPMWLPLSKINHLKEGDVLEVTWKGCKINLKVDQLGTRYGSRGNFESVLKKVTENYNK